MCFHILPISIYVETRLLEHIMILDKLTGLLRRVMGKPGMTKGGQIFLLSDAYSNRPRAYLHHHKSHPPMAGFTRQGPIEALTTMEDLKHLVKGKQADGCPQIFTEKPHSLWDNFFSGSNDIKEWIRQNGFGVTMVCHQDQLPRVGVPSHFMHKVAMPLGNNKTCVARFNNLINVVKHVMVTPPAVPRTRTEGKYALLFLPTPPINYTWVHVIAQSTPSCNITIKMLYSLCKNNVT
jgi:hypothetical protein